MSQGNTAPETLPSERQLYDFEYEIVPQTARKRWYVITLIWVAMGLDISGLFLGTFLSSGLLFPQAVGATLIGSALLGVIAALCANVGHGCGVSTTLLCISVFGRLGGKLIGLIAALSLLGWFAFQLDFFGMMLQKALLHYQFDPGRLPILIFGMTLMALTAIWGVSALGKLSMFSVPLMMILIVSGIVVAAGVQGSPPLMTVKAPISMGAAISYVVSIWIVAAVMAPDIARYAKTRHDVLLGAGLGFFFGNSATILVALILARLVGSDDLIEIFFSIGLGISAIVVLILAQWTTNSGNLVSAALGLSVVVRGLPRPVLVVLLAVAGLLLARNGMVRNFTPFLSLLGVLISPVAGVYLVEYYVWGVSRLVPNAPQTSSLNPTAMAAWCGGSGVSLLTSPDFFNLLTMTTVSSLDGILVGMGIYGLWGRPRPAVHQ
ncbi:cytosine permease [Brenneria uluponensis]|uniref:cytosine permease n=1 Tax=Brenneria uluponensis TaxID=3057057 RepID=UPI0028E97F59|nr:cytosine permease [Brenneria ulupoensis]